MDLTVEDLKQLKEFLSLIKLMIWFVGGLGSIVVLIAVWIFRTKSQIEFLMAENKLRREENASIKNSLAEVNTNIAVFNALFPRFEKAVDNISKKG